jgi:protein-disulfide isomerase
MSQQHTTPTKRERREAARAQRIQREQAVAAGETRRKRLIQLGGLLAAAVVIVVAAVLISSGGGKSSGGSGGALQGVAETKALMAGIPQQGVTLGKADAPVTIVEFADPQCPFCREYTLNAMPALIQKYVRTGKAKMELRYMTFLGSDSLKAARVLEAAGQKNQLWTASDLLYRNQGQEETGWVTDDFLTRLTTAVGLDPAATIKAAGSPSASQALAEVNTLTSRYGVTGTPTILVGPTGGTLKKDTAETQPTAAGVGQLVDAALAGKGGT